MAKVSNSRQEVISINAIKRVLNSYEIFKATFNEESTNKSIDGKLYIYNVDNIDHVSKIKGKINICVKCVCVKSIENEKISFSIGLKELRMYKNKGGSILFVVQIDESERCKIFYKVLSQEIIEVIIKNTKEKGNSFFATIQINRILKEKNAQGSLSKKLF